MEIENHLKHLKKIQPRADYVLRSRAEILTTPLAPKRLTWRQFAMGMVQSGSAMALVGVFFVMLAGGFSLMKVVGWDRQSITVEAQAIDMQIQLADLKYTDLVTTAGNAALKPNVKKPGVATSKVVEKGIGTGTGTTGTGSASVATNSTSTPSSTEPIGIDEALEALSQ
jgi:hypothetical protein